MKLVRAAVVALLTTLSLGLPASTVLAAPQPALDTIATEKCC